MTDLAKLVVRLEAESSRLTAELERSQNRLRAFDRNVGQVAAGIARKLAFPALAAGSALIVQSNLETIASYQDLSEKIGDTASNISRLTAAATISGTAFDTIAAASVKLTATLSKQDEDSKGAAQALRALGLDFNAFRAEAPVKQLGTIADALARFENGAEKTAVAVALFGKSGADLLPFLNDYAEDGKRAAVVTDRQAAAADDYTKTLARMQSRVTTVAQQFSASLAPAFNEAALSAENLLNEVTGVTTAAQRLSDQAQATQAAASAMHRTIEGTSTAFRTLAGQIDTVAVLLGTRLAIGAGAAGLAALSAAAIGAAGAMTILTSRVALSIAAVAAFNAAARATAVAFAFVGGIPTLVALAAAGIYAWADSQTEAQQAAESLEKAQRVLAGATDDTRESARARARATREDSRAKLENARASLAQAQASAQAMEANATADVGEFGAVASQQLSAQSVLISRRRRDLAELEAQFSSLTDEINRAEKAGMKAATRPPALPRLDASFSASADRVGGAGPKVSDAERLVASLNEQVALLGKSSAEAELYRLKLADGVTPAQIKLTESLLKTREAFEQKTAVDQFIAGLQQQKDLLGLSSSEAAIYQLRLMDGVTPAQLAQARALQVSIDAFGAQADAQRESAAIFEQTRTPVEKYIARIEELQGLLARGITAGGIDQSTFDRAVAQNREAFEASQKAGEDSLSRLSTFTEEASRGMQQSLANAIRTGFDDGLGGAAASFASFLADAAAQAAAANIAEGLFGKRGTKDDDGGLFGKAAGFIGGLFGGGKASPLSGGGTAPVPVTLVGAAGIGGGLFGGGGGGEAGGLGAGLLGAGGIGGSLFGGGNQQAADGLSGMIGGDLLSSFEQLTAASSAFGAANTQTFNSSAQLAGGLAESLLSGPGAAFTDAASLASSFFSSQAAGIASTTAASTAAAATTAATATATNATIAASAAPAAALTSIASFGGAALAAAAAIPLVTTAISALIGGFADGGRVSGPGTGTSDSILAKLSNREFVLPALAADRIGDSALELLRRGDTQAAARLLAGDDAGDMPAFARGGRVGDGARFAEPAAAAALARDAVLPEAKEPVVNVRVIQVASMEEAKGYVGSEDGIRTIITGLGRNRAALRNLVGA